MLKYRYQLGGNIMCTLSNFYRLLDNCNILGSATDEHAYQQSVSFNLNEFITDSNDEIYHHFNYALKFDQDVCHRPTWTRRSTSRPITGGGLEVFTVLVETVLQLSDTVQQLM